MEHMEQTCCCVYCSYKAQVPNYINRRSLRAKLSIRSSQTYTHTHWASSEMEENKWPPFLTFNNTNNSCQSLVHLEFWRIHADRINSFWSQRLRLSLVSEPAWLVPTGFICTKTNSWCSLVPLGNIYHLVEANVKSQGGKKKKKSELSSN